MHSRRRSKPKHPAHSLTLIFWIFLYLPFFSVSLQTEREQESSFFLLIYLWTTQHHSILLSANPQGTVACLQPHESFSTITIFLLYIAQQQHWQQVTFNGFFFPLQVKFHPSTAVPPPSWDSNPEKNEGCQALRHWDKLISGFKLKINDQKTPGISSPAHNISISKGCRRGPASKSDQWEKKK